MKYNLFLPIHVGDKEPRGPSDWNDVIAAVPRVPSTSECSPGKPARPALDFPVRIALVIPL
jgi:hypothetical protein